MGVAVANFQTSSDVLTKERSTMNHRVRLHSRLAAVLVVVAVASVFVPTASLQAAKPARVTVMTRNLYLGSGLTNLATASSFDELVKAVTVDWNNIVANDFPRRAEALATEIQLTRPDVVGLQEAMLFREQLVSDIVQGNPTPNATVEVYDFVEILQSQLAGAGHPIQGGLQVRQRRRGGAATQRGIADRVHRCSDHRP